MNRLLALVARTFIPAAALVAFSSDSFAQGSKAPVRDKPLMLEYSGTNSSYIQSLLNSNNQIRPSRRKRWNPEPTLSDRTPNQLLPFPIVRNFNPSLRLVDLSLVDPPETNNRWVRTGISGAGTTLSVDTSLDNRGNIDRVLLGSVAGGLFLKRGGLDGDWSELPYPRSNATAAIINTADANHFIVAHQFQLSRDAGNIFQSCDSGQTWSDSGPLSLTLSSGAKVDFIVRDMILVAGQVVVVGQDNDLSKVIVLRAQVGCKSVTRNGQTVREPQFNTIRKVLEVSSTGQPGYLKRNGAMMLLSVRGDDSDTLYRSNNSGSTWNPLAGAASGNTHFITAYDSVASRIVVAYIPRESGSGNTILKRSVNNGANFNTITPSRLLTRLIDAPERNRNLPGQAIDIQDIVLDADREDFIGAFMYMLGYAESLNNGLTFLQDIDELQDVRYFPAADAAQGADDLAVTPLDVMRKMRTERAGSWSMVFMPSDQGIFVYNQNTNALRNLTQGLRLVESRGIAVTECPRIYSGFWHVGAYFIGRDGLVRGFNGSESDGFGINRTPADACAQPAFNLQHGYLNNGRSISRALSGNVRTAAGGALGWPYTRWPVFGANAWFYQYPRDKVVYTISTATGAFTPFQPQREWIAHGVEQDSTPNRWYGLSAEYQLSWYTAAAGLNDLADLDDGLGIPDAVLQKLDAQLIVNGNTIVITGGNGTLISRDGGLTFRTVFAGKRVGAGTVDRCGWIYLAVSPGVGVDSGVFMSKNGGVTFRHVGLGDGKSYFRDLEMRESNRFLYAATYGESILKIRVPVVGACG